MKADGCDTTPLVVSHHDWSTTRVERDDSRWLLVVPYSAALLGQNLALVEALMAVDADAVVLRQGSDSTATQVLNRLPSPVAALAAPVNAADVVAIRPGAIERTPSLAANRSLAESLFRACCDGSRARWAEASIAGWASSGDPIVPRLSPSSPGTEHRWILEAAREVVAKLLPPHGARAEATAVLAGLLLLSDRLDDSHRAAQSIEGAGAHRNGDYWHAILHRREPDFGNSKYWFRSVGRHPVFPEVARAVEGLGHASSTAELGPWPHRLLERGQWQPMAFVDLCEAVGKDETSPLGCVARRIQWIEMLLLLERSWEDAGGGSPLA